ncbi:exodeoxyribonuclease VII large subunit [Sulfobacillus harzensis]|uniref:Exodeoxyribonuclease 7 large subunit n=1 Tax=Sulfobacillus harzensis TaxID=2729629 RepID=A0A7Y0L0N6_9FIRM|nr:exodeoxyribonuclease VII large subunit [Sulfobacillus harzensis]NMP21149.1 exodeoxyribonuclease VII large subunit [Sulfobacillus harzensis]
MKTFTVGELVSAIRRLVEGVDEWQRIWVAGELSGVRHHSSGHWYFTLKDETAQIRAVMFRRDAATLKEPLKDGMAVLAFGRVGVFERDGQTQLYVSLVRDMGRGSQDFQLEMLKQRLYQEGLFSRPKRRLPLVPRAVGVITSGTGAARFDIETVVARRFPGMPVVLYPVLVQGREAAASIVEALAKIRREDVDVLIIGRGGGAKEDLAAFNEEAVVRAVFASPVPVISAVGHEIDTTLVDLVADLRAPTPSAAAELAVPELVQLKAWQDNLAERLDAALTQRLTWERNRIQGWVAHGLLAHPETLFREYRHLLDRLDERAERAYERQTMERRHRLERIMGQLPLLNPELPLERGYAYVSDDRGTLVTRNAIQWDESYEVHWHDGSVWVRPTPPKGDEKPDE